jgi:hypothetical protein
MMTDGTVNDFRDPALDNLAASLDHLTRCFCDADERLTADEGIGGAPSTSGLEKRRYSSLPSN